MMRSSVHDPAPRHMNELDDRELRVLYAIRAWLLTPAPRPSVAESSLSTGPLSLAPVVWEPFQLMMRALQDAAIRLIMIRCPTCRRLSRDEANLLAVLALYQAGLDQEAAQRLEHLLPASKLLAVMPYLHLTAWALLASGQRLPLANAIRRALPANENTQQRIGKLNLCLH